MILGIGHDLCDIRRIDKALQRHGQRFEERVFTKAERIAAAAKGTGKAAFYAKRFAAKEAVFKAFSRLDQTGMSWHHAEITSQPSSPGQPAAPQLVLHGPCAEKLAGWLPPGWEADIHISLSDEYPMAAAFILLGGRPVMAG